LSERHADAIASFNAVDKSKRTRGRRMLHTLACQLIPDVSFETCFGGDARACTASLVEEESIGAFNDSVTDTSANARVESEAFGAFLPHWTDARAGLVVPQEPLRTLSNVSANTIAKRSIVHESLVASRDRMLDAFTSREIQNVSVIALDGLAHIASFSFRAHWLVWCTLALSFRVVDHSFTNSTLKTAERVLASARQLVEQLVRSASDVARICS
jgi:hypothetical protein